MDLRTRQLAKLIVNHSVFVKPNEKKGFLRVTSLSAANLNRIQEGIIAQLEFRKIDKNVDAKISFDTQRQVFAPAEANDQVSFGDEITL